MSAEGTGPALSSHLLRPSVGDAWPPFPTRGEQRLRVTLGSVSAQGKLPLATLYLYQYPFPGDPVQHDGLRAGDLIAAGDWRVRVDRVSPEGVEVSLVGAPDAE